MADAADSFVAATLAAKALRSMRPESSVLSGLDELDDEASALKLGPLLADEDEPTREVSALSEKSADCSSVPAPMRAGAGAFGAENIGASPCASPPNRSRDAPRPPSRFAAGRAGSGVAAAPPPEALSASAIAWTWPIGCQSAMPSAQTYVSREIVPAPHA